MQKVYKNLQVGKAQLYKLYLLVNTYKLTQTETGSH